ncbi:hypothetical protein P692DRAFT_20883245 [Suillus brevipes Sb2]|nr:hypothetical protein P692DRAFT_20883245 [Suillus brevipes Sb2]
MPSSRQVVCASLSRCISLLYQGRLRSKDAILHTSQVSKQQPNHRPGGLAKYGKDFWDADTNTEPRSTASPARPSFTHRWRDFLRLSTRPNTPQSIPLEPRRWNFNFLRGGSSISTVEVAAGRKKNVSGLHRSF